VITGHALSDYSPERRAGLIGDEAVVGWRARDTVNGRDREDALILYRVRPYIGRAVWTAPANAVNMDRAVAIARTTDTRM